MTRNATDIEDFDVVQSDTGIAFLFPVLGREVDHARLLIRSDGTAILDTGDTSRFYRLTNLGQGVVERLRQTSEIVVAEIDHRNAAGALFGEGAAENIVTRQYPVTVYTA